MKNKKDKVENNSLALTFLFSLVYFVITVLSFMIVIWMRYLLYKSPLFTQNHVPPHIATILFALFSLIIGTFITIFTIKMILRPLSDILDAVNSIAEGDYSVRVTPRGIKRFKKLGERFNAMAEEINSAEILKKDFVNNFSHEFKTPITSILGFAKILKQNSLTENEKDEYLDIIINESQSLTDLSQNILTLSRLENQPIMTDVEDINITEQLRLSVAVMDSRLSEKNIEILFYADECLIRGNRGFLRQVWINLIDNAIKFSPDNSSLRITAVQNEDEAVVTISNHAKPIDENAKRHIFDRFYQAEKSHSTQGNGLGLTLVHAIITNHRGTIELEEDDEYEVKFVIKLPNTKP